MRIDEFEFQDKNGNEIEPTKNQLVIYIKSLHEEIKDLEESQNRIAISELEVARNIASFLGCIEKDGEFYVNLTAMKGYLDGQIKMLKGE